VPKPERKCLYCDTITDAGNLKKHHDDNCKHKLKYIIACTIMSPSIGGLSMATSLAMDDTDYIENLDGCLPVLEEEEEYELCAKLIELKQLVPTVKFTRKQLKKDILNIISEL